MDELMFQEEGGEHTFPQFCSYQHCKNCDHMNFTVEIKCCTLFQCMNTDMAVAGSKLFLDGVIQKADILFRVAGG